MVKKKKKRNEPNLQVLALGQENFIRDESRLHPYSFGKVTHASLNDFYMCSMCCVFCVQVEPVPALFVVSCAVADPAWK